MKNLNPQNGYIALTSVIIISLLLITITAVLSSANYFSRSNILESEFKERSSNLAEGCLNYALARIAGNPGYLPTADDHSVLIGYGTCNVVSVLQNLPTNGQTSIISQGIFPKALPQQSRTNLKVVINAANLSIVSWEEIPN